MAQLTISGNVADARSLGGNWQRYVQITNTSTATVVLLSRQVRRVYVQGDTANLLVATEGAEGVALDAAAFTTSADVTREVEIIHPRPSLSDRTFPSGKLVLQPSTTSNISLRASST